MAINTSTDIHLTPEDRVFVLLAHAQCDLLSNILKLPRGVPTLLSEVDGNTYCLPLRLPDGSIISSKAIELLDLKRWNVLDWLTQGELDERGPESDVSKVILGMTDALKLQQDWLQVDKDLAK